MAHPSTGAAERQRKPAQRSCVETVPPLYSAAIMCTLALYFHVFPEYPIVVAANRDESLARPSSAPVQLWPAPWVYGGQDLFAGGTWFGINESSVVVGILNRQASSPPDPCCRSRGLLCLDALKHCSATAAMQFVMAQPALRYNPFTLVIVDPASAYVVHPRGQTLQSRQLTPGFYLFTNRDPNDPQCPRIARSSQHFLEVGQHLSRASTPLSELFARLPPLLSDHAPTADARDGLCLHLEGYGTCSSTLLAYTHREHRYSYYFAPGPPCRTTYREVSVPPAVRAAHPPSTT